MNSTNSTMYRVRERQKCEVLACRSCVVVHYSLAYTHIVPCANLTQLLGHECS